jgi:RHS repeat-associated protein
VSHRWGWRWVAAAFVLVGAVAAFAQMPERHRVVLELDADDDPGAIVAQLAATYRVHVVERPAATEIVVTGLQAKIRLLEKDRRVASVERMARQASARPSIVTTNATSGFGAYDYDGAGNIVTLGSDSFVYDRFGRIATAMAGGKTQTFTYDRHGNITKIATTGEADNDIGIGTKNRLSGATYDNAGNLLSYHGGTFVYDGLNVVTESRPTGGNRRLYLYNASNERIATIEILPGNQRRADYTIRDSSARVLRRVRRHPNGAWSWEQDYIYRGSQLLAAEVPTSEKIRFFHLDHLGTPRLVTGNGGAKLSERAYGAFGRGFTVVDAQQATPEPNEAAQFTGHERDSFQLDYMRARYYDPMMGRFLSVDKVSGNVGNPQSWNRYAYAYNSPLKNIDPDGNVVIGATTFRGEIAAAYANSATFRQVYDEANRNASIVVHLTLVGRMTNHTRGGTEPINSTLVPMRSPTGSLMRTPQGDLIVRPKAYKTTLPVGTKGGVIGHELTHANEGFQFGYASRKQGGLLPLGPTTHVNTTTTTANAYETLTAKNNETTIAREMLQGSGTMLTPEQEADVFGPSVAFDNMSKKDQSRCSTDPTCFTSLLPHP